ncbi:hypothetical protein [Luteolibacter marinus]|uniref:hypothetical protein n=1 Tax=Luteolibacter marinus TaxID=2776705 RepID=UPI001865E4DF|nr:hypothetical protein [Luteolibacter marinus]
MKPNTILAIALSTGLAQGQLIIADDFNITGDSSVATGFGPDGVNTEVATRLTGQAATDFTLSYYQSGTGKDPSAFDIADNRFRIAALGGVGAVQLSTDSSTGFDFGSYLVGKTYEILVTLDNDSVDTANRRFSFILGASTNDNVNNCPLSLQLQADANSAGAQIFKRVGANSNPDGVAINQAIASGLPYGEPVSLRIVIEDVDTTLIGHSTYAIYLNGSPTPADSGTFGFATTSRHFIYDIAQLTGPATYEDFSVTVTGDAPEAPVTPPRYVYFVQGNGDIRGFTGINTGDIPVTGPGGAATGFLEASQPSYGTFQGFTTDPSTGIVYGINVFGDVIQWPTLADWLADTNSIVPDFGEPGFAVYGGTGAQGSVHGISYDGNTGGFYVVYEGDALIDGDIGEYATAEDFVNNVNATVTASTYGGNRFNFYYFNEDAPTTQASPNDIPGANYFQASGGGVLEGFQTLADYISNPGNKTFSKDGFGGSSIGAFALPIPAPPEFGLQVSNVQRNGAGEVTSVDLSWSVEADTSYNLLGSPDLATPFAILPGMEGVTTSPQTVTVPAGYESKGFFSIEIAP